MTNIRKRTKMEKKKYLECAIIINTHGVNGNVKLESLCDTPKVLAGLKRVFLPDGKTIGR